MSTLGGWVDAWARRERVWQRDNDPDTFFRGLHRWWAARRRFLLVIAGQAPGAGGGKEGDRG